ncbi:MAG: polyphosphate--glucose phosphotransferase [Acidimicrobiia bacterium]
MAPSESSGTASAIGIDVGGTGIKGAPVDVVRGELAAERVRVLTPSPATPEAVCETVTEVAARFDTGGPIGITMPAVVRAGVVETAANIDPAWIGVDAAALFGGALGREVAVMNDADAAGVAEMKFGAGKDHAGSVVVVTLGTGIGSAVFADGVLLPNTELGHLTLNGRDAEEWAADSVRDRDELTWKHWSHRLEEYFSLLESLLWPELIIVGGGVSKKAEKFLPRIDIRTPIVAAQLQNEAGIIGAALHATHP